MFAQYSFNILTLIFKENHQCNPGKLVEYVFFFFSKLQKHNGRTLVSNIKHHDAEEYLLIKVFITSMYLYTMGKAPFGETLKNP